MSLFASGSFGWLLGHEIRLTLREMAGKARRRSGKGRWIAAIVFIGFLGFSAGVPLGLLARRFGLAPDAVTVALIDAGVVVVFSLLLSQTLSAATTALYQRGDLDLLFSSPLDPRRILAVRIIGLAASSVWLMLFLVSPIVVPAALIGGHPEWLSSIPVLLDAALVGSAGGTALSMALFSVLGARRTRTVAQILGALIGAAVFLATQLHAILGGRRTSIVSVIREWAQTHDLSNHPVLSLPARAALGDPVALLIVTSGALVIFIASAFGLGARFADHAATAAGAAPATRAPRRAGRVTFGRGPFASLLRKEIVLVLRDPTLISQTLMQVLYIIPPSLLLVHGATRSNGEAAPLAFGAGAVVFLAGQLAGGLGWVAVSGEDARDLIRGAPLTPGRIAQAKALAVVVMVMALLAAPLVALAWFAPWVACVALVGAAANAAAMALVEHWMAKPGKRSDFRHRQQTSGLAVTFSELLLSFLISAATVALLLVGVWGLIPAALAGLVLFLFSLNARTIDD